MSSSSRTPAQAREVTAVPTDPSSTSSRFSLKPLIAEILQTTTCIAGSILLVERIEADIVATRRYRAVRLLLGDGELCIQALIAGDFHGQIDEGAIYEGCYLRLDRFEFRTFNVQDEHGFQAKSAYLLVQQLAVVGCNNAYLEILKNSRAPEDDVVRHHQPDGNPYADLGLAQGASTQANNAAFQVEAEATSASGAHGQTSRDETSYDHAGASDDDDGFEVMHTSPNKATQRREQVHWEASTAPGPWAASDPTKPMKLTTLRQIPNLPYKQNWRVNVLAIIAALSDLEPSYLPPHSQRTVRLADPSTTKEVLLTVLLDPEAFTPKVGSVVLLVGVKNHRFDGGCLKKYESDRPADGGRWWYENPAVGWCDVEGLRKWWNEQEVEP